MSTFYTVIFTVTQYHQGPCVSLGGSHYSLMHLFNPDNMAAISIPWQPQFTVSADYFFDKFLSVTDDMLDFTLVIHAL